MKNNRVYMEGKEKKRIKKYRKMTKNELIEELLNMEEELIDAKRWLCR